LPQEKPNDIARACAEHFSNFDFFRPPFRREAGQAEEAQAGDENRDADKDAKYLTFPLNRRGQCTETIFLKWRRMAAVGMNRCQVRSMVAPAAGEPLLPSASGRQAGNGSRQAPSGRSR
jgi:hypothetical protein